MDGKQWVFFGELERGTRCLIPSAHNREPHRSLLAKVRRYEALRKIAGKVGLDLGLEHPVHTFQVLSIGIALQGLESLNRFASYIRLRKMVLIHRTKIRESFAVSEAGKLSEKYVDISRSFWEEIRKWVKYGFLRGLVDEVRPKKIFILGAKAWTPSAS